MYALFGWAGNIFTKIYKGLYDDIVTADMRIYPPAYASLITALTLIVFFIGLGTGIPLMLASMFNLIPFLSGPFGTIISIVLMFLLPGIVFLIGISYPKMKKISRSSKLDIEIPYLSVYVTVMATGGISPYTSFERLARAPKILFEEVKKEATRFYLRVRAMGLDPLSAIEESALRVPNKAYKQLMLGYAATLRAGGDVVHYLNRQTEMMLHERTAIVKTIGERLAMLMESYMAVSLLSSLVVYTLFVVNFALAQAGFGIGGTSEIQFFLFSYILLPVISGMFIYLADMMQPKYPVYDKMPYIVFFAVSLPITIILFIGTSLPFLVSGSVLGFILRKTFAPLVSFTEIMRKTLGVPAGYESGLGIILSLTIGIIPAMLVEIRSSIIYSGIQYGLTRFLRDLVEVRKTGMSPERCILNLSDRDYGRFTKHLQKIAREVGWGISLTKIFHNFARGMKNWFALIAMFLLVESIEVGGGTAQTLEALASYAETLEQVEKEKKAMLRPLMLIPYLGAIIIVIVVLILVGFMNYIMGIAGGSIGTATIINMFLPPVIFNSYLMGLVAGKVGSEKVSAGFKHAFLLTIASLLAIIFTPQIVRGLTIPIKL